MRCDCDDNGETAEHAGRRVTCAACGYKSHAWHGRVVKLESGERYVIISEAQGFEPDREAPGEARWDWPQGTRGGNVRVTRCCLAPARG